MNKVILMGRLTRDPEIRYAQQPDGGQMPVARYTLAVDRRYNSKTETKEDTADFIRCVCFSKQAEVAEKYFKQGTKLCICGRIQTGSYTNKEGQKVYTTDVIIETQEFAESKKSSEKPSEQPVTDNEFMAIPDAIEDDLPF